MSTTTSTTETYDVRGMTCDHCARSVTEEVSAVPGVSDVQVDLAAGTVRITTTEPITTDQVRDAVHEAGYQLA